MKIIIVLLCLASFAAYGSLIEMNSGRSDYYQAKFSTDILGIYSYTSGRAKTSDGLLGIEKLLFGEDILIDTNSKNYYVPMLIQHIQKDSGVKFAKKGSSTYYLSKESLSELTPRVVEVNFFSEDFSAREIYAHFYEYEKRKEVSTLKIGLLWDESFNLSKQYTNRVKERIVQFYKRFEIQVDIVEERSVSYRDFNGQIEDETVRLAKKYSKNSSFLPIFIINYQDESPKLQGISTCIRGLYPSMHESKDQLCAISLKSSFNYSADRLGLVVTHEIGHFLGLNHTYDNYFQFGVFDDGLSDTPKDKSTFNLMHGLGESRNLELSPSQIDLMLESPIFYKLREIQLSKVVN